MGKVSRDVVGSRWGRCLEMTMTIKFKEWTEVGESVQRRGGQQVGEGVQRRGGQQVVKVRESCERKV